MNLKYYLVITILYTFSLVSAIEDAGPFPVLLITNEQLELLPVIDPSCKTGFMCPVQGAVCCKDGESCCMYGCEEPINFGDPVTCKPNKLPSVLSMTRDPVEEAAREAERLQLWKLEKQKKRQIQAKQLEQMSQREEAEKKIATSQEEDTKRRKERRRLETTSSKAKSITHVKLEEEGSKREEALKQSQRKLPLQNRFRAYANGYRYPKYSRLGNLCLLSGVIVGPQQNGAIAKLPPPCRPAKRLVFDVHISRTDTARYDILPNGEMTWAEGSYRVGSQSAWVPLDGVSFPVIGSPKFLLPLNPPWVNYDRGDFDNPSYTTSRDGLCVMSGLTRVFDWRTSGMANPVFTVPPDCHPDYRLVFLVNHGSSSLRLDILPNGEGRIIEGKKSNPWVSLTSLIFYKKCKNLLPLENGWRRYSEEFRTPCYVKDGAMCALSGLARATLGWRSVVAIVPDECKPEKKLIFHLAAPNGAQRIDILPDGSVMWIDGKKGWVSLDGIRYMVE